MKTKTIVIIILCALVLFSARNYIKDTIIPIFNNSEPLSSDYTGEQQDALQDFKDGISNVFNLAKDGLFTLSELIDLGVLDKDEPMEDLGSLIDNDDRFSITDVDISSLNLENISQEQTSMLMQVFTGDMTMTELIATGKFTLKDFQDMGLFNVIVDNIGSSETEE